MWRSNSWKNISSLYIGIRDFPYHFCLWRLCHQSFKQPFNTLRQPYFHSIYFFVTRKLVGRLLLFVLMTFNINVLITFWKLWLELKKSFNHNFSVQLLFNFYVCFFFFFFLSTRATKIYCNAIYDFHEGKISSWNSRLFILANIKFQNSQLLVLASVTPIFKVYISILTWYLT
jgi:hypothetical protein